MTITKRKIIITVTVILCAVIVFFGGIKNIIRTVRDAETALSTTEENESDEFQRLEQELADYSEKGSDVQGEQIPQNEVSDSAAPQENEQAQSDDPLSSAQAGSSASLSGKAPAQSGVSTSKYGLSSSDKEQILDYYKKISAINADKKFHKSLTLVSMNGGETISQGWVDRFSNAAKRGLARNSIDDEPYPGKPEKILASDWQKAVAIDNGKYTTVMIFVVPQTDDANGSQFEGPCGRSMGVLDGMQRALQELPFVSVDSMDMRINYVNPVIKLTVDDQTGQLVKGGCYWSYRTDVYLTSFEGRALIRVSLKNASGSVDYKVSY